MQPLFDRLPSILEMELEDLPYLEKNASSKETDLNGSSSSVFSKTLRFIGVSKYALHSDVEAFKNYLFKSATINSLVIQRFESGEPISKSYVSILSYKALFTALAIGNFQLAFDLANYTGERPEIEKEYDHPFDLALGYALKAFVLENQDNMLGTTEKLLELFKRKENKNFLGYAHMFQAILEKDNKKANSALLSIVEGHKKESKGRGVFVNLEDEVLCVWGIGISNLAKKFGLFVEAVPPLIPSDLLV